MNENGEGPDLSFATELEEHEAAIRDALEERLGSNGARAVRCVSASARSGERGHWKQLTLDSTMYYV